MNINRAVDRLMYLVAPDLPALEKNSIVPNEDGSYDVFGQFTIRARDAHTFTVEKYNNFCGEFTSIKSALSWCIAEKYKQYNLSNSILTLETKRLVCLADLDVRSNLVNKFKNSEHRTIVELKLRTRKDRLKLLDNELSKCINLAKYWQIRGFNNETVRTGRTTSQRTSR